MKVTVEHNGQVTTADLGQFNWAAFLQALLTILPIILPFLNPTPPAPRPPV